MKLTSPHLTGHISLTAFALMLFIDITKAQQNINSSTDVRQQLSAGKTPGTYAFSYTGTVVFTQEPAFPVDVTITDFGRHQILRIRVPDEKPFTISSDLAPGSYWIGSSVAPDKATLYWGSQMEEVFIDPIGLEKIGPGSYVLLHQKRMTVLSPDSKGTGTIADKRPLLTWQALPGAVHYQVNWLVEEPPQTVSGRGDGETSETQFRFTEDTIPNRRYEWNVNAIGKNGERLGYWSSSYFYTPGGHEAFAKTPPLVTHPKSGMPYLGISPLRLPADMGMLPGIYIQTVGDDSPALKAGLQPHDVLTRFNGKALDNVTIPEFLNLVHALRVGSTLTLQFDRQGIKKSVTLTVEAMP